MNESQRSTWILAMPSCASINDAMNDLTGTGFITSEQYRESGPSRMDRDKKDITTLSFLKEIDPFDENPNKLVLLLKHVLMLIMPNLLDKT
jgi:hypothetical protein